MASLKWQENSKNVPISEMSTKWQEMRKCRRNVNDCLKMPCRELVATKASCSQLSWQNVDISCLKMRPQMIFERTCGFWADPWWSSGPFSRCRRRKSPRPPASWPVRISWLEPRTPSWCRTAAPRGSEPTCNWIGGGCRVTTRVQGSSPQLTRSWCEVPKRDGKFQTRSSWRYETQSM